MLSFVVLYSVTPYPIVAYRTMTFPAKRSQNKVLEIILVLAMLD